MKTSRKTRKRVQSKASSRRDPYQAVTETILEHLKNGTVPWLRPWNQSIGKPVNFHTGNPYRGINTFLLGWCGYASPHWLTIRQANALGGRIRKGEKGTKIVKFGSYQKDSASGDDDEERAVRYYLREFVVFNALQVERIEFPKTGPIQPSPERERSETAEQIVASMPLKPVIVEGKSVSAAYCRDTDTVEMPAFERFATPDGFHLTLFHELVHAKGHPSRLNRRSLVESKRFGSNTYSKEELVAEMGAAFLGMEAGIVPDGFEQSAAYLKGWLDVLGKPNHKHWIVYAASQASKAVEFILGRVGSDPQLESMHASLGIPREAFCWGLPLASWGQFWYTGVMSKTLEQIKADALALTGGERDRLIDELIEASVNETIDADRERIEATLQDRTGGPFVRIDDPEAHFESRLRYFRGETARRNAHG